MANRRISFTHGALNSVNSPIITKNPMQLTSPSMTNKIKCFVNKGTPNQRIRKISLLNVNSIKDLENAIRNEFEWDQSVDFSFVYVDQDGDHIEISSSLSIEEIIREATSLLITTPM